MHIYTERNIHPSIHLKAKQRDARCAQESDRQSEEKNEKKKAPNARMRGRSEGRTNQTENNICMQ